MHRFFLYGRGESWVRHSSKVIIAGRKIRAACSDLNKDIQRAKSSVNMWELLIIVFNDISTIRQNSLLLSPLTLLTCILNVGKDM